MRLPFLKSLSGLFSRPLPVSLMLAAANLLLIFPVFLPNLSEINYWDEAGYINSGRMFLLNGKSGTLASSPLSTFFYALTTLPFQNSPFWLIQSASLGRLLVFLLLLAAVLLIGRELAQFTHPAVIMGFALVTPVTSVMFPFASDPLYAAFSGLAFWKMLCFYNTRSTRHLWAAAAFFSLAAMARIEAAGLFAIALAWTLALTLLTPGKPGQESPSPRHPQTNIKKNLSSTWKAAMAMVLPFLVLSGGYFLLSGLNNHDFSLGMAERSYANFEAGQEVALPKRGDYVSTVDAVLEARRLFGAPQENQFNIFTAILRNPDAYFHRLKVFVTTLPRILSEAFGMKFTPLLILLSIRGGIELLRRRKYGLIVLAAVWFLPLLAGILNTIMRLGYLRAYFYVILALSAIGLSALLANLKDWRESLAWGLTLLTLTLAGLSENMLSLYMAASTFGLALGIVWLSRRQGLAASGAAALLVMVCAGLVLRGGFPPPKIRILGQEGPEAASYYLTQHLTPGSLVLAGSPAVIWNARMIYAGLNSTDIPTLQDAEEFMQWLRDSSFQAVYIDDAISPHYLAWIQSQVGKGLAPGFAGVNSSHQVYLVNPPK